MKKKLYLIAFLVVLLVVNDCGYKSTPTGKSEVVSEVRNSATYSVDKINSPTAGNTYLTFKITTKGDFVKTIKDEYTIKRQALLAFPILTTVIGIGSGITLINNGYTTFGRDAIIFTALPLIGAVTYNLLQKDKLSYQEFKVNTEKVFVPSDPFIIKLSGTNYSAKVNADKNGELLINILDFAPYYKEGESFKVILNSPEGNKISEYTVKTADFAEKLNFLKTSKYPPELTFTVSFNDSLGDIDNLLDADETGRIILDVKNQGVGSAKDLEVRLTPNIITQFLSYPVVSKIDLIESMQEKSIVLPITASKDITTEKIDVRIELLEPYFQADAEPQLLKFETRRFEPPLFIIYDKAVEEGQIVPGKSATIALILKNDGLGRAENVTCSIGVPPSVTYLDETNCFDCGKMESGQWQMISFQIFVGKRLEAESLDITLDLKEKRPEYSKKYSIKFPLNKQIQKPKEIVIKGEDKKTDGSLPPTLVSDVDKNIPLSNITNDDAIAVIIGNKIYENTQVPNVDFAENDARIMKEYLMKTLGFKEENIIYLVNAKKTDFELIFGTDKNNKGKLYNYIKENKSDVFVYYTGHGAPDIETKSGYFVPVDCNPDYITLNGYALETFFKNLAQLETKSTTVVIDACFSGTSEKGMLIAQASPMVISTITNTLSDKINLFTSAGPEEISSWYAEKNHSLFTYFFLRGLRGEGDLNKDSQITFKEMGDYLKENVNHWANRTFNRKQNPSYKGSEQGILMNINWE